MASRIARIVAGILLGLVLLVVIIVGGIAWRLSQGPIGLDFLVPTIQNALSSGNPKFHVQVGHAAVAWDSEADSPKVLLDHLQLIDSTGATALAMPQGSMLVATGPLLTASIQPTVVKVTGLRITLVRQVDGSIGFGLGAVGETDQPADQQPQAPFRLEDTMQRLTQPTGAAASFQSMTIQNAAVTLLDATTGQSLQATNGQLVLRRTEAGTVRGTLSFALGKAGGEGRLEMAINYSQDTGWDRAALDIDQVMLSALAPLAPKAGLQNLDFPVSGQLGLASGKQVRLWPLEVQLQAKDAQIQWQSLWAKPLDLQRFELKGVVDGDARTARIDQLTIATPATTLGVQGTIGDWGQPSEADLTFRLDHMDIPSLASLWPPAVATDARDWVLKNVSSGRVSDGELNLKLHNYVAGTPLPARSLHGGVSFADVSAKPVQGLPAASGFAGKLEMGDTAATLTISSGQMGGIKVESAKAVASDLDQPSATKAQLQAALTGAVPDVLRFLKEGPFGLADVLPLDPANVQGQARATITGSAPLKNPPSLADLDYKVDAHIENASAPNVVANMDLALDKADITVTPGGIEGKGTGQLGGMPFDASGRQRFGSGKGPKRAFEVHATLAAADAERLGVTLPKGISGKVPVTVQATAPENAPAVYKISADLTPLAVDNGPLGWSKPAGSEGQIQANIQVTDDAVELQDVEGHAADLSLKGSATVARPSWQVRSLHLDPFRLGPSSLTASITRGEGGYTIDVNGQRVDLRNLDLNLGGGGGGSGANPLGDADIQGKVAIAELQYGDAPVTDLNARFARRSGRWEDVHVSGKLPEGHGAKLDLGPDGRDLTATSDDAALLAQAAGLPAGRFNNGQLRLDATLGQDQFGSAKGKVTLRQFNVENVPILARIVSLMSLSGISAALEGKGMPFELLEIPFTLDAGKLQLEKARLVGSQIGLTARGTVDLDNKTLDLNGTAVPAYTVNKILGDIPIVGWLMRGQQAQGAFAATYTVKGTLSSPEVSVNPLSALVPGFIRDLFTGVRQEGEAQPQASSP